MIRQDGSGKLVLEQIPRWTDGYEITGSLSVKNLYAEAVCGKNLKSFNCEIHFEVESSLTVKGKLEGAIPIYKTVIAGPNGVCVKVIFSIYADMNGEAAIGAEIAHTTNVSYKGKNFKTVQDTEFDPSAQLCAGFSSGMKAEAVPTVWGLPLVDVSAKVGTGLDVNAVFRDGGNIPVICVDGNAYTPVVSLAVGEDPETLANKIGITASFKLIDKEGALIESDSETLWHYEITADGAQSVDVCTRENQASHTHSFGPWSVLAAATCTESGTEVRYCACGGAQMRSIAAKHTEFTDPAVAATCKSTGLTEGKHCSVCNTVLIAQTKTPVTAHTYTDQYDETCNVCGYIREAACAHTSTKTVPGKAATCTEAGLTDGKNCTKCGEIVVSQTAIPATGHTEGEWTVNEGKTGFQMSCVVCSVVIGERESSEGLQFRRNSDGESYSVTGVGAYSNTEILIPSTYGGLPVTGIGNLAFTGYTNLRRISIPNSVTSIGDNAFDGCSSLASITIPNGVTSIGSNAFYECNSLTSIILPNGVTSIGSNAFYKCSSLTSIAIPNSVTSIGDRAFFNCYELKSITIPSGVTSIGDRAFYGCSGLTSITIPDSVASIGSSVFYKCIFLENFAYAGRAAQWNSISLDANWKGDAPFTEILCSDGKVSLQ